MRRLTTLCSFVPGPALVTALLATGCVSARIAVVDERTALENQILGSYEELDRDMQLLASVRDGERTPRGAGATFSRLRRRAIHARQTQLFHRDDLDELQRRGCIGEVHDGTVAAHACTGDDDPDQQTRVQRLIEAENDARTTLQRFVVATSPELTERDLPQVQAAWARVRRRQARPGTWFRDPSGRWVRIE